MQDGMTMATSYGSRENTTGVAEALENVTAVVRCILLISLHGTKQWVVMITTLETEYVSFVIHTTQLLTIQIRRLL